MKNHRTTVRAFGLAAIIAATAACGTATTSQPTGQQLPEVQTVFPETYEQAVARVRAAGAFNQVNRAAQQHLDQLQVPSVKPSSTQLVQASIDAALAQAKASTPTPKSSTQLIQESIDAALASVGSSVTAGADSHAGVDANRANSHASGTTFEPDSHSGVDANRANSNVQGGNRYEFGPQQVNDTVADLIAANAAVTAQW